MNQIRKTGIGKSEKKKRLPIVTPTSTYYKFYLMQ